MGAEDDAVAVEADEPGPVAAEAPSEAPDAEVGEATVAEREAAAAANEGEATDVPGTGVTAEGRAVNDPRVAPAPVENVHVETARMVLFAENPMPPVSAPVRNVPRASNDPRGQKGANADSAESA